MKKFLALALSFVLACSVMTACGDKEDSSEKEKDSSSVSDNSEKDNVEKPVLDVKISDDANALLGETVGESFEASEDVFKSVKELAEAKAYTFDLNMVVSGDGMEFETPVVLTADGDNSYMKMSILGISMEQLVLDGQAYVLDSENKVYYKVESSDESDVSIDMNVEDILSFGDSVKSANKVTIGDAEFDRYEVELDGETGFAYFFNNEIMYLAGTGADGSSLIVFNTLSANANADLLKLPADYNEITEEEYYELVYGDMFGGDDDDFDFGDDEEDWG